MIQNKPTAKVEVNETEKKQIADLINKIDEQLHHSGCNDTMKYTALKLIKEHYEQNLGIDDFQINRN